MDTGVTKPAENVVTMSQTGACLGADFLAASTAALSITPIVCLIDSTIMLKAATTKTFGQCLKSFLTPMTAIPRKLLYGVSARLVFAVYLGTYATANSIDTLTNFVAARPASDVTASTSKFVGTALISTGLTVYKDSRMAKCLGRPSLKTKVPLMTYSLFTARDAITIFASFNLPILLAPTLASLPESAKTKLGKVVQTESGRLKTVQFLIPAGIQFLTTPIHLLGLDFYNRRDRLRFGSRCRSVVKDLGIAIPARMVRIIPAFGVGGIINSSVRRRLLDGSRGHDGRKVQTC